MFGKSTDYMHATDNTGESSIFDDLLGLHCTKGSFSILYMLEVIYTYF